MRCKTLVAILLTLLVSPILLATNRAIDAARSKITIHVGKPGLFSAAGHEQIRLRRELQQSSRRSHHRALYKSAARKTT